MTTKEPTLSDCRRILGQILVSQYTKPNERRIVELILGNVETQDKDFIRKLKEAFIDWGTELQELQEVDEDSAIRGRLDCPCCREIFERIIDELAGDKLSK